MSAADPISKTTLPARLAVIVCSLDGGDNLYPIARFHKRQDGHWFVASGTDRVALCLNELEGAHDCCQQAAMRHAAAKVIASFEARILNS